MYLSILALASAVSFVASASLPGDLSGSLGPYRCHNETIVSQTTRESGVVVKELKCHDVVTRQETSVEERDLAYIICPSLTTCDTICYSGNGGPNQGDCANVYNEIYGLSGVLVTAGTSWTYTSGSCEGRIFNQALTSNIEICPSAFGGTVQYLQGACNGAVGAQGGICVSTAQTATSSGGSQALFFIDVIHS